MIPRLLDVALAVPVFAGVGLLSFGAWLAWRPAGFMVAGALILADQVADRVSARGGEPE